MSDVGRCAIIGPAYPLRGGIAQLNESLARAFHQGGIDTEIFSFSLQYPSLLFPGKSQKDTSGTPPQGVKIHSVINSINPFNWGGVADQIAQFQPDLVVVRYWMPFFAPSLGTIIRKLRKKLPQVRVIALTDNIIPHEPRPGDAQLTGYFVNSCDAFVAMSQAVLNELKQFDSSKPRRLIHHPIYDHFGEIIGKSEARTQLGLNSEGKYILFFGLVRRYKGLDLLLEALSMVEDPNVRLIVAGEFYEQKAEIMGLIDSLGLQDRVIMTDRFVSEADVKKYFCAADLVVQPYRSATQSGVTQIAYHFNRPMLVTNVGGLPEMIPNGKVGYVVKVDSTSIADAINDFYQNDRESTFSSNAREEKKRFSWKAMVDGILNLDGS